MVNSFKTMKGLIIAYYVLNILASIFAIIMPFLSFYTSFLITLLDNDVCDICPVQDEGSIIASGRTRVGLVFILFVNFIVKLPLAIIASIKAKTILNNMNPPSNHDIEMNDIANVDESELTTNKSE